MPCGIKYNLHADLSHVRQLRKFSFYVSLENVAHAAAGGRHGHFHVNQLATLFVWPDDARVNQAEIRDIDGNFRIIDGLQLVPNHLFVEFALRGR